NATSFTITYDGTPVVVSIPALLQVQRTATTVGDPTFDELKAHIQSAIDAAMVNAAVANVGDVHVFSNASGIHLELGLLARTWHTIANFEPGFEVGFVTVQTQLMQQLNFAQSQIALYPANATLVNFYQSE